MAGSSFLFPLLFGVPRARPRRLNNSQAPPPLPFHRVFSRWRPQEVASASYRGSRRCISVSRRERVAEIEIVINLGLSGATLAKRFPSKNKISVYLAPFKAHWGRKMCFLMLSDHLVVRHPLISVETQFIPGQANLICMKQDLFQSSCVLDTRTSLMIAGVDICPLGNRMW